MRRLNTDTSSGRSTTGLARILEALADKRFGRYQVIERIGAGAMGAVYRARDDSLGREVAVKTIHTLGRSGFQLEMFRARFDNEARAVAALAHPNIVNVFDVGVQDDTPFLVMELVEGSSLAARLEQRGTLGPEEVRVLGAQLASALGSAHAQGIVHRDVKPSNVLEAEPGVWKLADFGVAHVPDSSLTLAGQFLGSPAYAAPESLERGVFGPASDMYALAATLYEAVAGAPPFGTGGVLTVGALAANSTPRQLIDVCPALPVHFGDAIMAALDRDPHRRPTADQLAAMLRGEATAATFVPVSAAALSDGASRRPAVALAIAGAVLVLGIALGVAMSSRDEPDPPAKAAPAAISANDEPAPADASTSEGAQPPVSERVTRKNEKHWRKLAEKLRQGNARAALGQLREILKRNPGSVRARSLYKQLAGHEWSGESPGKKHKRKRHHRKHHKKTRPRKKHHRDRTEHD